MLQQVSDNTKTKQTIQAYKHWVMVVFMVWIVFYMDLGEGNGNSKKQEQY